MKKAVIFDMDGVLVDNRDMHIDAFMEMAARHGLKTTREVMLMQFGKTNRQVFDGAFSHENLSEEQMAAYGREKEEIYRATFDREGKPLRGLVELLKDLKARGVKIAVGSSGPEGNVRKVLEKFGITEYFDAIVHGDMVERGKPDPGIFLAAANLLGTKPGESLVFEDAIVGIEAARRAGMNVVALLTTFPKDMLSGYDMIINDFSEIDGSIVEKL